jgi:serine/threonine-protein kinase
VAAALAAAHALGLVHRDIKPANVMVTPARAKVVDFGIAAAAGPGRPDAEVLGTPAYLAPERLLRDTVEPASDVYALGVLLYRLLTNESPWSVDTTTQMLDAHIYIEPHPMPQLPGVPSEVTDLVTGCLRKEPGERPTAAEAATILADAADASVVQGLAAAVRVERPPAPLIVPLGGRAGIASGDSAGTAVGGPVSGGASGSQGSAGGPAGSVVGAANGPAGRAVGGPISGSAGGPPVGSAVGSGQKPKSRRTKALAAAGVAAAVVAAALLWIFIPDGTQGNRDNEAAIRPGTSVQPSAAADAPSEGPAAGGGGEQTTGDGSVLVPGGDGPPGSVTPAPNTEAPNPGQATTETTGPVTTNDAEPTTQAPATTVPPSGGKTLTSAGGTVIAQCAGGKAELTSWDPAEGYKVEKVNAGPALASLIIFKKKASRIRTTVTCVAGIPTAVVLPL